MINLKIDSEIIRKEVEAFLPMMEQMMPRWCDVLTVIDRASDAGDRTCCTVDIDLEYNHATISVYPTWLTDDSETRREHLRHEMFHMVVAPAIDFASSVIRDLLPDGRAGLIVRKQFRIKTENIIQELARRYEHVH